MPRIRPKVNKVRTRILTATQTNQSSCRWVEPLSSLPWPWRTGMGGTRAGAASAPGAPGGAGCARTHRDLPALSPPEAGPPRSSLQRGLTTASKAQRRQGIKAWTEASQQLQRIFSQTIVALSAAVKISVSLITTTSFWLLGWR